VPYLAILSGLLLATDEGSSEATGSILGLLLPLILFGGLFYLVLIMPQRRRQRQMDAMRSSIVVGDRITTVGGIRGRVKEINGDEMVIDVGGGMNLTFTVRAIAEKVGEQAE